MMFFVIIPVLAFLITAPGGLLSLGGPNAVQCAKLIPYMGSTVPADIAAAREKCAKHAYNGGYVTMASIGYHSMAFVVVYMLLTWLMRQISLGTGMLKAARVAPFKIERGYI